MPEYRSVVWSIVPFLEEMSYQSPYGTGVLCLPILDMSENGFQNVPVLACEHTWYGMSYVPQIYFCNETQFGLPNGDTIISMMRD